MYRLVIVPIWNDSKLITLDFDDIETATFMSDLYKGMFITTVTKLNTLEECNEVNK